MKIVNFAESNSLVSMYIKELRDVNVQNDRMKFRANLKRLGEIVSYEISKTLDYDIVDTTTPLGVAKCAEIKDKLVLATVMRAGLPFHEGFLSYFDHAENAFVSAYRKYRETNPNSFDIVTGYIASPSLDDKTLVLVDPMLATGSSMEIAYRALLAKGTPAKVHIAAVIASKQAVDYIEERFAGIDATLWVCVVDDVLNEHSYIVPGLGDAGDLAYGEKL